MNSPSNRLNWLPDLFIAMRVVSLSAFKAAEEITFLNGGGVTDNTSKGGRLYAEVELKRTVVKV